MCDESCCRTDCPELEYKSMQLTTQTRQRPRRCMLWAAVTTGLIHLSGHFWVPWRISICNLTAQLSLRTPLRPVWELGKAWCIENLSTRWSGHPHAVAAVPVWEWSSDPRYRRVGSRAGLNSSEEGKISCLTWDLNNVSTTHRLTTVKNTTLWKY